MPEDQEPAVEDETGPTCLYKDDQAQVFEGAEVAKAMKDGWMDHPPDGPEPEPDLTAGTEAATEPASDG